MKGVIVKGHYVLEEDKATRGWNEGKDYRLEEARWVRIAVKRGERERGRRTRI